MVYNNMMGETSYFLDGSKSGGKIIIASISKPSLVLTWKRESAWNAAIEWKRERILASICDGLEKNAGPTGQHDAMTVPNKVQTRLTVHKLNIHPH